MSEERFVGIERRLETLEAGQVALRQDVSELKHDVSELKHDVSELKHDVSELKHDVSELKRDVHDMRDGIRDMRREMLVLHEDTLDAIRALAPDFTQIRREFQDADRAIYEPLDVRVTALEVANRRKKRQ